MSTPATGRPVIPARAPDSERVMTVAGQVFARQGGLFSLGVAAVVPFAFISLAVTTRYLGPGDYGRLGILFTIASIITVVAGMAVVPGVLMLVYGAGDDEGDGDADGMGDDGAAPLDLDPERIDLTVAEKRRLLGSGILLTVTAATAWCGAAALLAPLAAEVFLGSTSWTGAFLLMAVSAWTGAIWRLVNQVWRVERRPIIWSLFQALRPFLVVSAIIAALVAGLHIEGVLIATAAGTALATLICLASAWRFFTFRPQLADAKRIIAAGRPMVPIGVARLTQAHVSIVILSLIAPAASVGLFYAAARIAMIPSYFAAGFQLAWIPLSRSAIGSAGKQHRGSAGYSARVFTLLVLTVVALVVLVSLGAVAAIRIAAPSFGSAVNLIPVLAVSAAAYDFFHAYYRASSFDYRREWYTALLFIWLLPYAGALWLSYGRLAPSYAVIGSQIVATACVFGALVWLDRRGRKTLPVPWLRLGGVVAIASLCVAAVRLGGGSAYARLGLGALVIAGFPVVLRITGLLSREDTAKIVSILKTVVPLPMRQSTLRRRLESLRPGERRALELVGWRRLSPEDAAAELGVGTDLVRARVVRGLRSFMGAEARATPADAAIGRFVLSAEGTVESDLMVDVLGKMGMSLVEMHELEEAMLRFRRARRRGLKLLGAEGRAELDPAQSALALGRGGR
jgi:O-antigen/teichoic acid export membrane protein